MSSNLSKHCSGACYYQLLQLQQHHFYAKLLMLLLQLWVISVQMILSMQTAQNHITLQSESPSSILVLSIIDNCNSKVVTLQYIKKFSLRKQLNKQLEPELALISIALTPLTYKN